jgi:hypothetical protein
MALLFLLVAWRLFDSEDADWTLLPVEDLA